MSNNNNLRAVGVNTSCEVILTDRGVRCLYRHYQFLGLGTPDHKLGDTFATALWELMQIFGPACTTGSSPVFLNNDIRMKLP